MAIFQPTNILPDLLAGNASGTVFYDPNDVGSVEVSWSVNGNSALVAYQIDFFQNNAASTAAGSTGKVTLDTPFSAVSSDGTVQRFSCSVAGSLFVAAATAAGGYTGKFRITQWWGSGSGQSVVQRSLTVFKVNGISSVSAAFDVPAGFGGVYNFEATFTAPNPDHFNTSLVWTRWQIFPSMNRNDMVIQDTGKVWGATSYAWTCQQLLPGSYYVLFTAMTSMGELLQSNWVTVSFGTSGSVIEIGGAISAECDAATKTVEVTVNYSEAIQGVSSPNPDFSTYLDYNTGNIVLPAGASASWDIPATLSNSKWGFAWVGKYLRDGTIVSVTQSDGTVFDIHMVNGAAYVNPGNVSIASISAMVSEIYFFLTTGTGSMEADNWYLYVGTKLNGTYNYYRHQLTGFTQKPIVNIRFEENTTTMQCRVVYGNQTRLAICATTGADLDSTIEEPQIIVPYTADQSYAEDGYAIVEFFGPTMDGGAIFRSMNGEPLEFFATLAALTEGAKGVYYDYGVANNNTYAYYVVHQRESYTTPTLHKTESVVPCWWEWALIEAEKTKDGEAYGTYKPVQEFYFSMNVSSGNDGNGAAPGAYNNFTPYPVVMRDVTNRHSGTLSGLIGYLDGPGEYRDTNDIRDAIRALSASENTLFLRSRRGDLFKVAVAGEISMTTEDNSPKQQVSVSIPWVEIGPVDGSIVSGGISYDLGGGL